MVHKGVCKIILEGLWTVHTLVAGDARPRCGHHPESVCAEIGVGGAEGFSFAFGIEVQGAFARRVYVSRTSSIFANPR